ncbi:hypothetical protein CDAR_196041 [Caerostris darwini]|uniref:Uncharacterized protein n=1 Tax=Caerostris darwini TaxID=1538125 RepID=A0AAV4MGK5_9ARAC|nr:hypothetical protein CDAR_196041 [Caerostris darwini]
MKNASLTVRYSEWKLGVNPNTQKNLSRNRVFFPVYRICIGPFEKSICNWSSMEATAAATLKEKKPIIFQTWDHLSHSVGRTAGDERVIRYFVVSCATDLRSGRLLALHLWQVSRSGRSYPNISRFFCEMYI